MRVIIVDDELLARAVLREYLGAHADVEIAGECANGFEAVKAIAELAPDLVFLDIQMPKLDGFEVVELAGPKTQYVFVTAYDQFALRAFEVHALDYLLKPFSRERLDQALAHARARLGSPQAAAAGAEAVAVASEAAQRRTPLERILIRDGSRVQVIPATQIDYIEAQDDYVQVVALGRAWLKSQRLSELEEQLDPRAFLRVHRSYILSLAAIERIEPSGKDGHCAVLRGGARVPVSRSGYARLRELMR
ncbi:LytR/AlgR family response regulator transcription factor [Massilia norwichensis]|uniref:LytTR family transcriptional regulator DNA-binding domain-containing protein n=1 Tax=Massilia norwichensis TaxID=1442366 RepID=A0ABT2A7N6_9BURK|nr:LytTR family transcriptional regulator DNA-binding domain-containing protein [Massilia norwichensis]MCS0590228.1 LytTR family transcriptional regulator DNA-binding domain-containing protein [Massilia norwichensis]